MKGFLFFSETKAVGGVEPPLRALQAPVLPLDHTTIFKEGRIAGIEPALSIPQTDALTTELYPPQETSSINPVNPIYEGWPATALWERIPILEYTGNPFYDFFSILIRRKSKTGV